MQTLQPLTREKVRRSKGLGVFVHIQGTALLSLCRNRDNSLSASASFLERPVICGSSLTITLIRIRCKCGYYRNMSPKALAALFFPRNGPGFRDASN
jgi:hypothetical protein